MSYKQPIENNAES